MSLAWWQILLLKAAWQFTVRAYGAGLGDKVMAAVRSVDDDPTKTGGEKFAEVLDAVRQDLAEAPGEVRQAGLETAGWMLGDLINGAVRELRIEQGAAPTAR